VSQLFRLDSSCTVYQAECLAIREALRWISTTAHSLDYVTIHSDCQSAIASFQDPGNRNPIVREALTIAASLEIPVYITWVRGHSGVAGNERADELAKEAAASSLPICYSLSPSSTALTTLHSHFLDRWNERWTAASTGAITREFFPTVHSRLTAHHIGAHSFTSTQLLTGHANLNQYYHRVNRRDSDSCVCASDKPETVQHLIFECDRFAVERLDLEAACLSSNICFPCPLRELAQRHNIWTAVNEFVRNSQRLNLPRTRAASTVQIPTSQHLSTVVTNSLNQALITSQTQQATNITT